MAYSIYYRMFSPNILPFPGGNPKQAGTDSPDNSHHNKIRPSKIRQKCL